MRKIVIACRTGKGEFVRVHNDEVGKRLKGVVRRLERGNRGGGAQCDIKGAAQDGRHETGRTQGDIIQDVHAVGFMDGGRGVSAKTGADTANVNAMTAVLISFISPKIRINVQPNEFPPDQQEMPWKNPKTTMSNSKCQIYHNWRKELPVRV